MSDETKNPHAVAIGRLGGLKGGRIRAANMTPEERKASASSAAKARWSPEARAARLAKMNERTNG